MENSEKISKYFTEKARDLEGNSFGGEGVHKPVNEHIDSPYKSSLKEINCHLNDSVSDEKDFMSPLVLPKKKPSRRTVITRPAKSKPRQRAKREKKKVFTFQKTIEDSFKYLDVNADHLQMAVALSESAQLALSEESEELILPTTESQRNTSLRSTLEKFGFRHGTVKNTVTTLIPHEVLRKKKKSKFSHVTPTLLLRTEEDREALLTSKVSQVLSELSNTRDAEKCEETLNFVSKKLQHYYSETKKMFTINSMGLTDLNSDRLFSTKSLLLLDDKLSCCGCLLRKWDEIPGREASPPRTTVSRLSSFQQCPVVEDKISLDTSKPEASRELVNGDFGYSPRGATIGTAILTGGPMDNIRRSISPDLFSDDDPSPLLLDEKLCSKYTLEEFEEDNGICHFESFHENNVLLTQRNMQYCIKNQDEKVTNNTQTAPGTTLKSYDLTLSSDDEQETKEIFSYSNNPQSQKLDVSNTEQTEDVCPDQIELVQEKKSIKNPNEKVTKNNQTEPGTTLKSYDLTLSSDDERETKESFGHSNNAQSEKKKDVSNNEQIMGVCPDTIKLVQEKAIGEGTSKRRCLDQEKVIIVSDSDEFTKTKNFLGDDVLRKEMETANPLEDDIMNEDTIIVNNFSQSNSPLSSHRQSPLGAEKPVDSNNFSATFDLNFSTERSPDITTINDISNSDRFELSSMKTTESNTSILSEHLNVESGNKLTIESHRELQESNGCTSQACSQELLHISDEELNYSSNFNYRLTSRKIGKKLEFSTDCEVIRSTTQLPSEVILLSDEDNRSEHAVEQRHEHPQVTTDLLNDSAEDVLGNLNVTALTMRPTDVDDAVQFNGTTPVKSPEQFCMKKNTPKNNVIIKTSHVTPIPDYDFMDTPKILKELDRFGVKPLKRQRGVQLLKYIYDSTHPIVGPYEQNSSEDEDVHRKLKKQKRCDTNKYNNDLDFGTKGYHTINNIEIIGDIVLHSASIDELIFERRQSSRVLSCRIPLDIVWHNFVSSNQQIRENILLYEPLQLEVLHNMLKEDGYKFHIQDLLKFLDRKCITVRVAGSQGHRKRKKLGT